MSFYAPARPGVDPARPRRLVAAIAILAFLFAFVAPAPARADKAAATRNIILGAAAIAAVIIISNNVRHKQIARDTVVGRTTDGGLVYGDGRVVYPNGDVLYTGNGDGRRCGYGGDDSEEWCGQDAGTYYPRGYNGGRHGDDNHWHHRHHDGDHHHDDGQHGDHEGEHDD
ncbi:MAG: hypothetical protein NVS4B3_23990 [Gemmatimonadaceae bacterium]